MNPEFSGAKSYVAWTNAIIVNSICVCVCTWVWDGLSHFHTMRDFVSLFGTHLFYVAFSMIPHRRQGSNEVQGLNSTRAWGLLSDYETARHKLIHFNTQREIQIQSLQYTQKNPPICLNGEGSMSGLRQPGFQQLLTLSSSDKYTIINSGRGFASVFRHLSLPKTHKQNVGWRCHDSSPTDNLLPGLMEREAGGAEAADRLGFSWFGWDKKLPLSTQAPLTFIRLRKMANAARPRGKWSACFELNTLLTDCRAGMVQQTQTVCRPGRTPPFPTLVPWRQGANVGSTQPCPCLLKKTTKQNMLSLRQGWKTETGTRHRVH